MAAPIELTQLARELNIGRREHIALVGGGGKTTIMHALGRQLDGRVILTSTTKMGSDQDASFRITMAQDVDTSKTGKSIVWSRVEGNKAIGVTPDQCDQWASEVDYVIIEADGARQRPFKAPAAYEPVVPKTVTLMVSVIGADALGRVIADQCHRPLRVAALAECEPYQRLSPAGAAKVLLHPRGARRERPSEARFAIAITKIDDKNVALVDELLSELRTAEPDLPVVPIQAHPHRLP